MDRYDTLLHELEEIADLYSECEKQIKVKQILEENGIFNYDYDGLLVKCGPLKWGNLYHLSELIVNDKLTDDVKPNADEPEIKVNSFRFRYDDGKNERVQYSIYNDMETEFINITKIIINKGKPIKREEQILTLQQLEKFIHKIINQKK